MRRTTTIVVSQTAILVHQATAISQQVRLRSTTSRQVKAPPKRRRRRRALIITVLLVAAGATTGGLLLFNKPSPTRESIAAVSPDGKYIASANYDHSVYIWNTATRHLAATLSFPDYTINDFSFSPDSKTLVVEPDFGPITIWDIATQRVVKTISTGSDVNGCFALSPDGKSVAVCGNSGEVNVIDTANGHIATLALLSASSMNLGSSIDDIAFSPNGQTLAIAVEDVISCSQLAPPRCTVYSTQLWDVRTRRITAKLAGGGYPLVYSHDGSMLFVGYSYRIGDPDQYWAQHGAEYPERNALVWQNPGTSGSTWKIADGTNYHFDNIAFSPDGKTLAAVNSNSVIFILKVRTNQEIATFPESEVRSLDYTPDGKTLVVAAGGHVDLWDLATGQVIATLSPPS